MEISEMYPNPLVKMVKQKQYSILGRVAEIGASLRILSM